MSKQTIVTDFKSIEKIVLDSNGNLTKTQIRNIHAAILNLYPNINTRSKYISSIKKTILALPNIKKSIVAYVNEIMRFEGTKQIIENYKANLNEKSTNLDEYRYQLSSELAQKFTLQSVETINKGGTFFEVLGAICALTGRRPSEVLRGEWSFEQREFYLYAKISNAAKKRNSNETIEFPIFEVISIENFVKAINFVQNHELILEKIEIAKEYFAAIEKNEYVLERKIREYVEKSISQNLNDNFKRIFCTNANELAQNELKSKVKGLHAKQLRQMYGHFAAYKLSNGNDVKFEGKTYAIRHFFSLILSHGKNSTEAEAYYCEMKIV